VRADAGSEVEAINRSRSGNKRREVETEAEAENRNGTRGGNKKQEQKREF
jgi:hypothetical protein